MFPPLMFAPLMFAPFSRCSLLFVAVLLTSGAAAQQPSPPFPPLRIAAAADLAPCIDRLNAASGTGASATTGASGSFYAQIRHGAPFDVFLSADTAYPRALADAGLADPASLVVYAHGRLVLWAAAPGVSVDRGLQLLTDPAIRRIAIANPEVAPYGKAARAALQRAGVWERIRDKLVFGENIAQTMQFVESGNAQVGLVSSAHLAGRQAGWMLPADAYPPIEQGAILIRRGSPHPQAAAYLGFLRSDKGRALLADCGFALPPGRE
jgi:molybdate transport system substrate-binding protein